MPDQPETPPVAESPYDLDETPNSSQPVAAAPVAQPALPPRDPDTGRFTKPSWLLDQARELGFTDEDIRDYTADQLGAACTRMRQRLDRERSEWSRLSAIREQTNPTRPPVPEADAPPPLDLGIDETGRPRTEADFDPGFLNLLKSQRAELHEVKKQLKQSAERDQQRGQTESREHIESVFAGLPDHLQGFFGKGDLNDISPIEQQRRKQILQTIGLIDTTKAREFTRRQLGKAIEDAASTFGLGAKPAAEKTGYEAEETPPEPKPSKAVEKWNRGGVAKPTNRQVDDLPNGKEKAARNLAANLAKYNLNGAGSDSAELGVSD